MISADMLTHAIDNPAPATIILISGDSAFTYPISLLRLRQYGIVVIVPSTGSQSSLESQASAVLDWDIDVLRPKIVQKQSIQRVFLHASPTDPVAEARKPVFGRHSYCGTENIVQGSGGNLSQSSSMTTVTFSERIAVMIRPTSLGQDYRAWRRPCGEENRPVLWPPHHWAPPGNNERPYLILLSGDLHSLLAWGIREVWNPMSRGPRPLRTRISFIPPILSLAQSQRYSRSIATFMG